MDARILDVGTSVVIEVDPALSFIATGVLVMPGQRLRLTASGLWKDGRLAPCDASGWNRWYASALRRFNRVSGQNYMMLCASLGRDLRSARAIGCTGEWAVALVDLPSGQEETGAELFLFANDWPSRYGNNRVVEESDGGPMRVVVSRLS